MTKNRPSDKPGTPDAQRSATVAEPTRASLGDALGAALEPLGIRGATDVELRLVTYDYKVTHITEEAAEVALAQARARIEIAESDRDARIAEANAQTKSAQVSAESNVSAAKAERDRVVYPVLIVASGMVVITILFLAAIVACGILSKWDYRIVAPMALAIVALLLGGGPTLAKWAKSQLGS